MSEGTKVENLIIEHLRAIRADVAGIKSEIKDNTYRLQRLEERLANMHRDVGGLHADYAGLAVRVDKVADRMEHIEKRLEIAA